MRPSPAPVSSSKSYQSCKKMGCQNVRGYPRCLCHTPSQPLPAPFHLQQHGGQLQARGTGPASCTWGGKVGSGPHRGSVPSEAMPCLPHLPKCSPELGQACRASQQVLVQSQDLPGAAREP